MAIDGGGNAVAVGDGNGPDDSGDGVDLDAAWVLHPQVTLRSEPFGALLYHFGTRRLSLVEPAALGIVVRTLGDCPSVRDCCAAAGLNPAAAQVVTAMDSLARTGMIVRRDPR